MLGNYPESEIRDHDNVEQIVIDPVLGRRQQKYEQNGGIYQRLMNTNLSEKSEITVETSRMINSEISFQMSGKLLEMKSDLNSYILEVLITAIEEKILPSIEKTIASIREVRETKRDLRSGERHPDKVVGKTQKSDLKSYTQQRGKTDQQAQELEENNPMLIATSGNRKDHHSENLVNSDEGDDDGYDTSQFCL